MPYIKPQLRDQLKPRSVLKVDSSGELNFQITQVCLDYLSRAETPSYERYNAVIGALECAKLEMYRRRLTPYEDGKIAENGDVY